RSQQAIAAEITENAKQVPGIQVFVNQTNSLGMLGAGSELSFALAGEDYDTLAKAADAVIREMEDDGRFGRIRLSYETTQPQLTVQIDRERASLLGINIDGLAAVMQAMLDGRSIGSVFVNDRAVDVKLVSTTNPINDPTDLENIFIKTGDGR